MQWGCYETNSIIFIPSNSFRPILIYNFLGLRYYRGNGIKVPNPKSWITFNSTAKKIGYRKDFWVFFQSTGTFVRYSRVPGFFIWLLQPSENPWFYFRKRLVCTDSWQIWWRDRRPEWSLKTAPTLSAWSVNSTRPSPPRWPSQWRPPPAARSRRSGPLTAHWTIVQRLLLLLTMSQFSCMPNLFDSADRSIFLTTSCNFVSNFKVPLGTPVEFEMYVTLEDCDSWPQVWSLPNLFDTFGDQASPPLMMF